MPAWLPMPPSTTIARMIAVSMKVKLSGLTKPCRVANNEPAMPAMNAPEREGRELDRGRIEPERDGGGLVLAQRFQRAAKRKALQPPDEQRPPASTIASTR